MAQVVEDARRVRVKVSQQEMNDLLVQPARDAGYLDFTPTRVLTKAVPGEGFEVTFERTESINDLDDGR